jgi:hypothetical protein
MSQAKEAHQDLLKGRRDGDLPVLRRSPKLADYWQEYFSYYENVKDAKRLSNPAS